MPTRDTTDPRHAWANALELGSRGRYGEARVPLHYAMGASVRAQHLRDLGAADEALDLDDDALLFWEDTAIPMAWPYLDLKIGRSYDALAANRPAEAGEWLAAALGLEELGDHRTSIRLVWCAAELALALDRAPEALELMDGLPPLLTAAGQPRLDVATMLLRGRVLAALGDDERAATAYDAVLKIGAEGMWHSLMWRAAVERADVSASAKERSAFRGAARVLVELISEDLTDEERASFAATLPAEIRPA